MEPKYRASYLKW